MTSSLKTLLASFSCHSGLYPGIVSQSKHFLPWVTLVGIFHHGNRNEIYLSQHSRGIQFKLTMMLFQVVMTVHPRRYCVCVFMRICQLFYVDPLRLCLLIYRRTQVQTDIIKRSLFPSSSKSYISIDSSLNPLKVVHFPNPT